MNTDVELIKSALDRRFARAGSPICPAGAWRIYPQGSRKTPPGALPPRFGYLAALAVIVALGAAGATAAGAIRDRSWLRLTPFMVSTQPLVAGIHPADVLTMAVARRRMPFVIVDPAALPNHTRFLFAHVISQNPPRVALTYETPLGSKYYRVIVEESTAASPPVVRFESATSRRTRTWTEPVRQWRHGSLFMVLLDFGLPDKLSERIQRANSP